MRTPEPSSSRTIAASIRDQETISVPFLRFRNSLAAPLGFCLAVAFMLCAAGSAAAAPSLEITGGVASSPASIRNSDEFAEYKVGVIKNSAASASVAAGDSLLCDGLPGTPQHTWTNAATFSYQWFRNGAEISGATEKNYVLTGGDAGKVIQCVVRGTKENSTATVTSPTQPPLVVSPVPAGPTPTTSNATVAASRPTVSGTEAANRTCSVASLNWTNVTTTKFQWLRDGNPIPGATTSAYSPGAADLGTVLQCRVILENAEGAAISDSNASADGVTTPPNQNTLTARPFIVTPQWVHGLELEVELPAGERTFVTGTTAAAEWTCKSQSPVGSQHAKVLCSSSFYKGPGESFAQVTIKVAFGPDRPETAVTIAKAKTSNAPTAEAKSELTFLPALSFGVTPGSFMTKVATAGDIGSGVTITAVTSTGIELSAPSPVSGVQVLSAGAQPFAVGQSLTGTGIALGTTITAVSGQTLTLSTPATASGGSIPISAGAVSGTATVTAGSNTLTSVVTAAGVGVFTAGSKQVINPESTVESPKQPEAGVGTFAVGQTVSAPGITNDHTQAGGHPYLAGSEFDFNLHRGSTGALETIGFPKTADTETPRGFVGNALAVPVLCESFQQVIASPSTCPPRSMVGGILLKAAPGASSRFVPIWAIKPEYGTPAQFAFAIAGGIQTSYTLTAALRPSDGYAISLIANPLPKWPVLQGAVAKLCSFGAKGGIQFNVTFFAGCKTPNEPGANPVPLVTNPTRCSGAPPTTGFKTDTWEERGNYQHYEFAAPQVTGCENVDFEPEIDAQPTSHQADSPTGLDVEISMPTDGLESPTGIAQANLDRATVTLPKGMSVNPALASGLGACTQAQVKLHSNEAAECPESSKIGSIEIDTPIIEETLTGSVFVAKQNDNPFKSTLGLYMVFSSKKDGVTIKVAGKAVPDPQTGQLVTTFDENPEAPFSRIALHLSSGPRAALINPPSCGSYAIHSEFSPWSAANPANPTPEEIVSQDSSYEVTSGPGGGACPNGGLSPKFKAGLANPTAATTSPFVMSLSRDDGSQRFVGLDLTMPKGLSAYLKGVPYCSDAVLAGIPSAEETGAKEIASPACPAASQVGTVSAGAGAGPDPFYVNTGKAYLAGPYKGAPLSLAIVTPAVAGPFDLGNVVVRAGLYLNPETAQVTVKSDPIPTILHGIVLDIRDLRVSIDRPHFTVAPTSCEASSVTARVSGELGGTATVSSRFQVGGCAALSFKPSLSLQLFGGTHRGGHPQLRATLKMPEGGANIGGASVALPHSEFLDQSHIRTVCTRVQFAAGQCPAGAVYGHAEATSPLLGNPLSGPVYLRSSDNPLPDLVAVLRGPDSQPIEVDLDGRIDSIHGGIRNTFDVVPDAPVSSFTLNMQGGKKGLLVNSRNLCNSVNKATAVFTGQNGKTASLRPVLKDSCKKAAKKHKRHQARLSGR